MNKKIAVLGTGANGSCISADLIKAGHDVTMIDPWFAHVEAMRADGLTIQMAHGDEIHVKPTAHHICDVCTFHDLFDVVFICFKAYDTRWAAELIKPYVAPDGLVVGAQNGLTADDIAEIVGPSRTIGCVVELASEVLEPGLVKRVTNHAGTWFGVGALDPSMEPRVPEIVELLEHTGRVSISEDVRSGKWMKLIVNSMSMCPNAMIGRNGNVSVTIPEMRALMLRCGEEALLAGQKAGYRIEPVFGLTREELEGSNRLLEVLLEKMLKDVGPSHRNTVTQDHDKGRRSECDLMNGWVVEQAQKQGWSAPANRAIQEITRRIASGELKPDPSNIALALDVEGR